MNDWKQNLATPASLYQHFLREQTDKNAVLIQALQIAYDCIKKIADETDPANITALAKATVEAMTKIVDKKLPAEVPATISE